MKDFRRIAQRPNPFAEPLTRRRHYVVAPRTWVPGELVTASMMNTLRDLFLEIEAGTAEMTKVLLEGKTTAELASLLSSSGQAAVAYNTTLNKLQASLNGAAYAGLAGGLTQTFRGLTLRTHPDYTQSVNKVWLDHADEIVMNDGESVLDWNDLACDISASGAGGIDTGSEGASRWYEIHAIRKSSDGTKNLLFHRAKNHGTDQSQMVNDAPSAMRFSATQLELAQTFTCGVTGSMPYADIGLNKTGSPTGQVWLEIRATSGGAPTGSALYTSEKLNAAALPTSSVLVRFIFRTPPALTSGTVYALVMNGDYTVSGSNYIDIRRCNTSLYAGGAGYIWNATSWTLNGTTDFLFRTFITQNDSAVTMPSGYDQSCHIGHVYNDSGSFFVPFRAQDRFVSLFATGYAVSAGAATLPTLTDMSILVPPCPVIVPKWYVEMDAAGRYMQAGQQIGASSANVGGFYWTAATSALNGYVGIPLLIEFQHLYYMVNAGSANYLAPLAYQW